MMKMNEWVAVCRVEDIPVLGSRRVARAQGAPVALFRNQQGEVVLTGTATARQGTAPEGTA